MLETVEAVRYIKDLTTGRNCPWLIDAERGDGEVVEVVAKLASSECGPGGLVRETYGALLAADLNLPIAEPFVVHFSQAFLDTLEQDKRQRVAAGSQAFGSRFIPNMLNVQPHFAFPTTIRKRAAEVLAFDAGVVNSDRLVTKPNCLTDGVELLMIDHELSLNLHGRGFLVQDPWNKGALASMATAPSEHLFYRPVKENHPSLLYFSAFAGRLTTIQPSRIDEYSDAIPPEWDKDAISAGINAFLKDLIANAHGVATEVDAILT